MPKKKHQSSVEAKPSKKHKTPVISAGQIMTRFHELEIDGWKKQGVVFQDGHQCAWFFRFVKNKRQEKFVPLDNAV